MLVRMTVADALRSQPPPALPAPAPPAAAAGPYGGAPYPQAGYPGPGGYRPAPGGGDPAQQQQGRPPTSRELRELRELKELFLTGAYPYPGGGYPGAYPASRGSTRASTHHRHHHRSDADREAYPGGRVRRTDIYDSADGPSPSPGGRADIKAEGARVT